jgi:hypothetical protein
MTAPTADAANHVANFIKAMNDWEVATWRAAQLAKSSADPSSHLDAAASALYLLLLQFCDPSVSQTQGQAPYGHPPVWDPSSETIVSAVEGSRDAVVETIRNRPLGGGRFRYHLVRADTSWRIVSFEKQSGEEWVQRTLPSTDLQRVPAHLRPTSS